MRGVSKIKENEFKKRWSSFVEDIVSEEDVVDAYKDLRNT